MKRLCFTVLLTLPFIFLSAQDFEIGKNLSLGNVPVLVLLIDFSDAQFSPSQDEQWIDNYLFSQGSLNITDYYKENSEGKFSFIKNRIIGPLRYSDPSQPSGIDDSSRWCAFNTLNNDESPKCPGTRSSESAARRRVIQMAHEAGVDFNIYDRNRDGKVSLSRDQGPMELLILWVEGSPGGGGAFRSVDCIRPNNIAGMPRQPELCGGIGGVGDGAIFNAITHEISHALGTIDLYNGNCASYNSILSCPYGQIRHMDPWHKMFLGWINPKILKVGTDFNIGQNKTLILSSSENRPSNYYPATILANPEYRGSNEFFILEYRSNKIGSGRNFDSGVTTDGGLVVWQVNNWKPERFDVQPHNFAYAAGGWRNIQHVRDVGDINGDKIGDLIGFGGDDVIIMQGGKNEKLPPSGIQFGPLVDVLKNLTKNSGGWQTQKHVRTIADVNGDGKADLVGFGQKDVLVAISNSTVQNPRFLNPQPWLRGDFTYEGNDWRVDKHVRTVADVNGDGRADLVGFGQKDVLVALAHPTENRFLSPQPWLRGDFTYEGNGWRVNKHVRTVADVNGDGRADLVGFGQKDVLVALAHPTQNRFLNPKPWLKGDLTYEGGGWRVYKHVRTVADVNGDGKADLVGFGNYGVDVRIANTSDSTFSEKMQMRKVFSVAPNGDLRSSRNKMGLYGGDSAFTSADGTIELKWLNGRPAFSIEIIRQPSPSSIEIKIKPDQR